MGVVQSEPIKNVTASMPPIQNQGTGYDLPAIGGKRGMGFQVGAVEENQLIGGTYDPHASAKLPGQGLPDPNAGKSFQELLREKRLKAEQEIKNAPKKEEQKGPSEEEKAERKKRLQAIREQQLKKKQAERQQELTEFNDKVENKNDLHQQLL